MGDEQTKSICDDDEKLDAFFATMCSSIIAIVYIKQTVKASENKQISKYKFANVPKRANYHWIISKHHCLSNPIANYSGVLGVKLVDDKKALKKLRVALDKISMDELQKNHLYIPEHIRQSPKEHLIKYDANGNVIRLIYDSEDENDENKENESSNSNIKLSMKKNVKSQGIRSECGKYWVTNVRK